VGEESTLLRQLERQEGSIIALAFQPDGRRLAVGGAAPEVRVYDTDTGKRVSALVGHEGGVYSVVFHPGGELVATGGFDGTVRVFETEQGKLVKSFIPVPLEKSAVSMK
jgi:WD40 repeat protein